MYTIGVCFTFEVILYYNSECFSVDAKSGDIESHRVRVYIFIHTFGRLPVYIFRHKRFNKKRYQYESIYECHDMRQLQTDFISFYRKYFSRYVK